MISPQGALPLARCGIRPARGDLLFAVARWVEDVVPAWLVPTEHVTSA
ncbi:MAG TPA: hypothetical protein VGC94_01740 [Amnibacterium sp.]